MSAVSAPPSRNRHGLPERVQALLRTHLDDAGLVLSDWEPVSAGSSRDTYSLTITASSGQVQRLIARLDAPGAVEPEAMAQEAALMRAARAEGVPSPAIVVTSTEADVLGTAYIIMELIEGETLPARILRDPKLASAREQLAAQCGQALAKLHRIDPTTIAGLRQEDQLDYWHTQLIDMGFAQPTLEFAVRWLRRHRPAPTATTVVHGDFRNGNLIVGPDGIRAVLDWELAHIGDPLEDLGWLCVKAWRFGRDLPVGGFGTIDQLVEAYEAHSGRAVDLDVLHWWMVFGTFRWGVICVHQANRHLSGTNPSLELAAIGRRVAEPEWDLLELLS